MGVGMLEPTSFNIESNGIRMAFLGLKNGEQDCDVTSTNALESYHSELKRLTSPQHGLIVELDKKKCSNSEHVAYEFRVKRISAIGVDDDILQEIHKFLFPVQQMLITGFDIYISHGLVNLEVPRMTEAEKATENRQLAVSELMKRVHDMYWRVEKTEHTEFWISKTLPLQSESPPVLKVYAYLTRQMKENPKSPKPQVLVPAHKDNNSRNLQLYSKSTSSSSIDHQSTSGTFAN
ncbi:hypothetical protein C1646_751999 [Rhizophagus diaphanus]|nr:hypothetical protein C1646_751999 [Rhizophagus diaphanus] [Rhizophagus sp. MUCL 43196]